MTQDCKYLQKCPIWQKFSTSLSHVWIKSYCQGNKQDLCARKKLKEAGKEVPALLLPNGSSLDV
ncbi:MAG: hypothetical protein OEV28_04145 [Nitrospirota bacterium]|nr:hypothetical protein [Nitrospirota bacterium]